MSVDTTKAGGFAGDPAEALNPPAAAGGCCGGPAASAGTTELVQVSTCCGTAAEAKADDSCCGTAAKADAVASAAGCCG
jgi:hypothetical protein